MECPRCGTLFEGNYCPACGAPAARASEALPELCARCGTAYAGRFCPQCGWPAGRDAPQEGSTGHAILGALWLVAILLFLAYLVAILAALAWVSPAIVGGILGGRCGDCQAVFFWLNPLNPDLVEVVGLPGLPFLAWFLLILAILAAIYAFMALRHGRRTVEALRLPSDRVAEKARADSALVSVGQLFLAILFFEVLYLVVILPVLFNIEPDPPDFFGRFPQWYIFYSLVNAAVWEEALTRMLLIGLPLAVGSLAVRSVQVLRGVPETGTARYLAGALRYLLGGNVTATSPRDAQVVGGVLVFLSAALFGYLHVPGWGAWKFVDTFVAGLALGYLFLRRGLGASILLHFSVNSLTLLAQVTGAETELLPGALLGLVILALVVLGAGFFAHYLREVGALVARPFRGEPRRVPGKPSSRSSSASEDLLFFVSCPRCGGREAQYREGRLTCTACGNPL